MDDARISKRVILTVVAALAVAATLIIVFATAGDPSGPTPAPGSPSESAAEGWRWESYGGVEVQVPDDWGQGTTGTPPCLNRGDGPRQPYVGRPGVVPMIGCSGSPVPALGDRTSYLWFDSRSEVGMREHDGGWVEETRVVAGLALTVFTDDAALRTRILDSARPGSGSAGGDCPAEHPVTAGPDTRPDPGPGGIAAVGTVESITLCRYGIGRSAESAGSPVLSTSEVTGESAAAVVRAILAAPQGSGPNEPGNCLPEVAYGNEVLLLTVQGSTRAQEVFVRYSGCDGHGVDDGHTQRQLTAEVLKPVLSGPHQPTALHGAVAALVW